MAKVIIYFIICIETKWSFIINFLSPDLILIKVCLLFPGSAYQCLWFYFFVLYLNKRTSHTRQLTRMCAFLDEHFCTVLMDDAFRIRIRGIVSHLSYYIRASCFRRYMWCPNGGMEAHGAIIDGPKICCIDWYCVIQYHIGIKSIYIFITRTDIWFVSPLHTVSYTDIVVEWYKHGFNIEAANLGWTNSLGMW